MSEPRTGFAIFCEDIRQEANGKFMFIGVFGTDMVFQGAGPFVAPRLVIPLWIRGDVHEQFSEVGIIVTGPGPEGRLINIPAVKTGTVGTPQEGMKFQQFQTTMVTPPFAVERPQTIEVLATVDGEEITCGRLHIRFIEAANAAEDAIVAS
jgi:hypothetical protein